MDEEEARQVVEAWIKAQYAEEDSPWKERLLWAEHRLWQLTHDDPERAWGIVLQILDADSSMKVLQNLSAGPLEDLLSEHGQKFIGRVEEQAKQDKTFRKLLGGVWQNEITDEVWKRIEAIVKERW